MMIDADVGQLSRMCQEVIPTPVDRTDVGENVAVSPFRFADKRILPVCGVLEQELKMFRDRIHGNILDRLPHIFQCPAQSHHGTDGIPIRADVCKNSNVARFFDPLPDQLKVILQHQASSSVSALFSSSAVLSLPVPAAAFAASSACSCLIRYSIRSAFSGVGSQ